MSANESMKRVAANLLVLVMSWPVVFLAASARLSAAPATPACCMRMKGHHCQEPVQPGDSDGPRFRSICGRCQQHNPLPVSRAGLPSALALAGMGSPASHLAAPSTAQLLPLLQAPVHSGRAPPFLA